MDELEAEAARLESALESTLFGIMLDFAAPQPTRDAADRILNQRLNERLKAAIGDFQVGSMRLLELVDQLGVAVAGLGKKVPKTGATAELPALLGKAAELHRHFHDSEGMRTTHSTQQEAEAAHPDEQMLPPSPPDQAPPLNSVNGTGQILHAPVPSGSTRYDALADEHVRFFAGADFRDVEAERIVDQLAAKALQFSGRYKAVGDPLGIPWWFIAGIHMLESSFNFSTHLHNGDPLTARTFRVPAGRPAKWNPPSDWESSARDALQRRDLDKQQDWSLPRALYRWEAYNGFGYRTRHVPSPYLWSLSTIYRSGKFVADGVFDRNAVSQQCGAATLLKHLHQKGHVALTLDRLGEAEDTLSPAFVAAAEAAAKEGRTTADTVLPANEAFEKFLAERAPGLVHFKPGEFLMLGGSGGQTNSMPPPELWPNVVDLAKVLEALRAALGHPIVLNSVYRSDEHNAAVGGVKGSQHGMFRAADFRVVGRGSPSEWAATLRQMRAAKQFQGGIGVYPGFVHVDTRGWNADW